MRRPTLAVAFVLTGSLLGAQVPQPQPAPGQPAPGQRTPPRGAPPRAGEQPPAGSAVMRGQVTAVDGTPLRRAQVRVMGQDGRGGGIVSTDTQGRFEVKELPAGRYTISATKAGYVTMQFGQRRPEQTGSGTILDVLDNQLVEKIAIVLPRGGVITGRIVDEFGESIAGAQVQAQRYRFMNGARRLTVVGMDQSDDIGNYRIYGLAPGDYVVSGMVRSSMMSMPGQTSSDSEGYAPSYYPGTPSAAEAQRVTVKGGQELSGVNFALTAARLARVRGRVTTAAGDAPAGPMMLMVISTGDAANYTFTTTGAQTRADGTFQLNALSPGTYTLTARPMNVMAVRPEIAQVRLVVANEDIDNVLMPLSNGALARGTITTDEGVPMPMPPQSVRLTAASADPMPDFGSTTPTINDDWSFELAGLFGRRSLRAALVEPGSDWFLKGVYYRDQNVTDTPIEFTPGQVLEGFNIVFTRKTNEITGIVTDDKSQPVLDASIVIFPNDSSKWTYLSRYMRTARVDQSGRFRLRNLPTYDEYRLAAVQELEEGRWSDPEFLEQVREGAARVTLGEGQTVVRDMKVQRAP